MYSAITISILKSPEEFPKWHNSDTAKLFSPPKFENKKIKAIGSEINFRKDCIAKSICHNFAEKFFLSNMNGFYKHKKGNIYKVLFVAKHTESLEDLVIYQDINDEHKIGARPIGMFLEKGRFTKISKNEAFTTSIAPKYRFPDIQYTTEIPNLIKLGCGFSKSVKSMITLLTKRGLVDYRIFDFIVNDDDLERLILDKIKKYKQGDSLEDIFHLIQIWGGSTGRVIYVTRDEFNWNNIVHQYQRLVNVCSSVFDINEQTISQLIEVISEFDMSVKNISVSFITKHTRYWLYKSLGNNALPIYDSIMANYVMQKKAPNLRHLAEYWNIMVDKAKDMNITLMSLERQIFIYAFDFLRHKEIK